MEISSIIRDAKRKNLTSLNLSGKNLQIPPREIWDLVNLTELNLSKNKISLLDGRIGAFLNLETLDLSYNNMLELPTAITKLKNLKSINLEGNPLKSEYEPLLKSENQNKESIHLILHSIFPESGKLLSPVDFDTSQEEFKKEKQIFSPIIKESPKAYFVVDHSELTILDPPISQGGFSTVHRGQFRGCEAAIQRIFNPNITQDLLDEFHNEIDMLSILRHPNIIILMAIVQQSPLCIVTEFVPQGDLFNLLHKKKVELKDSQQLAIMLQVANVFLYLQKCDVVHRDLKSYNILLDENMKVKLCDFGLAKKTSDLNRGLSQFSGTPAYMAPQVFLKRGYDQQVDVFAFGSLLWEIFAREVPFDGLQANDIAAQVIKDEPLPNKSTIPTQIMQIVKDCRNLEPSQRPDFDKIFNDLELLASK